MHPFVRRAANAVAVRHGALVAWTAMATPGISHGGRSAEERFRQATGATKPGRAGDGDAVLDGCVIEVKRATAATLNQVRAVKYIPLVVLHEPTNRWYVVPAHIVVCLVAAKKRGQHTENPFESSTVNVFALGKYEVAESDLRTATIAACQEANTYPEMKEAMATVLRESKALATKSTDRVTALIKKLKLAP